MKSTSSIILTTFLLNFASTAQAIQQPQDGPSKTVEERKKANIQTQHEDPEIQPLKTNSSDSRTEESNVIQVIVPDKAIEVSLSRSGLIWATIIISLGTLVLSFITFYDKIIKDKRANKKELLDDFWYKTVIHKECATTIDTLCTKILGQLNATQFSRKQMDVCFKQIHVCLAKLDILSLLPEGKSTYLSFSEQFQNLEEQLNFYWLYSGEGISLNELANDGLLAPETLINGNVDEFVSAIKHEFYAQLLAFHTTLNK
ncbi:MAG: hypothetical protein ABNH21_05175 [Glaciecola sp.]|jgi:hypothetical protein